MDLCSADTSGGLTRRSRVLTGMATERLPNSLRIARTDPLSQAARPGLNYPHTFHCHDCGDRRVVKRSDACDFYEDPNSQNALNVVLKEWGWVQAFNGIFCPDYAGGKDRDLPLCGPLRVARAQCDRRRAAFAS